jgi:beta-glucosidase/6-phospho-beta-glucosidase/beta-galactosidase
VTLAEAPELELDRGFVVASGIECSAPLVDGRRVDELAKTGHTQRFADDFRLAHDVGVRYLRYGIPFHRVNPAPGRFDWGWVDRALQACREAHLVPIVDLMHFGVPDDIRDYQNAVLADRYEAYVEAFVARYPWVRYYTPVNEPYITAAFSARQGYWNEQLSDERAFVRALLNVSRCSVLGAAAIRRGRPDAILVQAETCQFTHPAGEAAAARAELENELRFVTFDLAFGRRLPEIVRRHLLDHGTGPDDLDWFERNGDDANWIVGNDYYAASELEVDAAGTIRPCGVRLGYYQLAHQYFERLGRPVMHTETNMNEDSAAEWLAAQWAEVSRLREEGLPIRGFTWYGLVNHVDWDSVLVRDDGRENACGLVSLDRRPNKTYEAYRRIAEAELERVKA